MSGWWRRRRDVRIARLIPLSAGATSAAAGDGVAPRYGIRVRAAVYLISLGTGLLGLRALLGAVEAPVRRVLGHGLSSGYVALAGGVLLANWWTLRTVDGRGWGVVGLGRSGWRWRAIVGGAALGAAAVGVPALMLLGGGWLKIESSPPGSWISASVTTLALLVPAALWEELFARGYLFTLFREWIGVRGAVLVTAVLFGLLHVNNPGATWQSVSTVTLAGIFLGMILAALRSLYAAWAAHVSWNFVMAGLLHSAVSGIGMGAPNYKTIDAGPDWATGGTWGPEASWITAVGLTLGIYLLLRRTRRGVLHDG